MKFNRLPILLIVGLFTLVIAIGSFFVAKENIYAISVDSSSVSPTGGPIISKTWSHTVSGVNRLLVVGVGCRAYATVSSITYNGVALTKSVAYSAGSGNFAHTEIWYLLAPPVGTYNIVVTLSTEDWPSVVAASFTGVNQSTPIRASSNDYSSAVNSTAASLTINPTAANDMVLASLSYWKLNTGGTPDASQTLIGEVAIDNAWRNAVSIKLATAATTTMIWNSLDSRDEGWAESGISIVPTADYTAPVVSATAPATNGYINTSTVSYTLSEAVGGAGAGDSNITFTRTGGTADSNSPHKCVLQGTALSSGAHSNLLLATGANSCVSWTALVNGAVYSVSYNVTDTSGNKGTTVTNTNITFDTTAPVITITNPNTSAATSKTITASTNEGTLVMAINAVGVTTCNDTLTFSAYSATTFTSESDNGKTVCYRATDSAGNKSFSLSSAIAGIDRTPPTITINNPDTSTAFSKTITASASEGTLKLAINASGVTTCDGTLTFSSYTSLTFTHESDNGRTVCYYAYDSLGNGRYSLSNAIQGVNENDAPVVSNILINNGNSIDLIAGAYHQISITATITDADGFGDMTDFAGKVYRSGVTSSCSSNEQNCYNMNNNLCSAADCSGLSCTLTCKINMQYVADATDSGTYASEYWMSTITVTDSQSASGSATSTSSSIDVNSLQAINLSTSSLNYGNVKSNSDTGSTNQSVVINNVGNTTIDIEVSGSNMCVDYPACSGSYAIIPPSAQKYATGSFTYASGGTALSSSSARVDISLAKGTKSTVSSSQTIYWGLGIPAGIVPNNYSGLITIDVVSDT